MITKYHTQLNRKINQKKPSAYAIPNNTHKTSYNEAIQHHTPKISRKKHEGSTIPPKHSYSIPYYYPYYFIFINFIIIIFKSPNCSLFLISTANLAYHYYYLIPKSLIQYSNFLAFTYFCPKYEYLSQYHHYYQYVSHPID